MILVDSSVWIHHLRYGNPTLGRLLEEGQVATHDFVIGELACGSLKQRHQFLELLQVLPRLTRAEHGEVLYLVEAHRLYSRGLGWVDVHLLASVFLDKGLIWSLDKMLIKMAQTMGVALVTAL